MMFTLTLVACASSLDFDGKDTGDSAPADTDSGADPDAPVVESVTGVECSENTDGEPTWFVGVVVSDPQGADTLSYGSIGVYADNPEDGGDPIDDHPMVCHDDGTCASSWEDLTGEMACGFEGWLRVTAEDDDGHVSAVYDHPFRS